MNLTDEQRAEGKAKYADVLKVTPIEVDRREFMGALAVGAGGLGAAYYQYSKIEDPLKVGIIGTGDEGNVLIGALNPEYVKVVAICDIRPASIHRAFHGDWPSNKMQPARPGLMNVYGWETEEEAREQVKVYTKGYDELLADEDVEAVIIALPLWLHADAAIDAMLAGKHVLTEKLMAHSVAECKEMARVAEKTDKLLATGHQRHYSVLYSNAVATIKQGVIGDIHHIRAQWHRAADSWRPAIPHKDFAVRDFDLGVRERRAKVKELKEKWSKGELSDSKAKEQIAAAEKEVTDFIDYHGVISKWKSVKGRVDNPNIPASEKAGWIKCFNQLDKMLEDANVDAAAYGYEKHVVEEGGYECSPLEELIRWRLWNRTGGGLMAELGSHQLDASSIFIASQFKDGVKVQPISVTGVGGRHLYEPNRDIDDHVYCTFEFPGKGYFKDDDPKQEVVDENKKVVVTYSSINGNGYGGYGEVVMGTDGTLILERESETILIGGKSASAMKVAADAKVDSYETGGGAPVMAAAPKEISRGYTEEIEHWAWCIRNKKDATELHCYPKVAMADAIIALTSNIAMATGERIDFKKEWFDIDSDETPEGDTPRKADDIGKSDRGMPTTA